MRLLISGVLVGKVPLLTCMKLLRDVARIALPSGLLLALVFNTGD